MNFGFVQRNDAEMESEKYIQSGDFSLYILKGWRNPYTYSIYLSLHETRNKFNKTFFSSLKQNSSIQFFHIFFMLFDELMKETF